MSCDSSFVVWNSTADLRILRQGLDELSWDRSSTRSCWGPSHKIGRDTSSLSSDDPPNN
jgi:hypothetical protein